MTDLVPTLDDYIRDPRKLKCRRGGRSLGRVLARTRSDVVSVITVTLNSAATLARTMESVFAQSYPKIEYIVVDGGSTDGTLGIIRECEDRIDLWVSEPDLGISDAFNKGIALASGEFIALVNSDDWLDRQHMSRSIECLRGSGADFTFGNLMLHNPDGTRKYVIIGDDRYERYVRHSMPAINHPSVVCRRTIYERYGLYDKGFRIAMDYEWLIRAHTRGVQGVYVADVTSHMGATGISQRRIHDSLKEVRRASIRYGYPSSCAYARYGVRILKLGVRLSIERWISQKFAGTLRAFTNSQYRRIR